MFIIALTDWQFGARSLSFVGLAKFRELFADAGFGASLLNTFVYALIVVPGTVVLGLLIALLIESGKSCRSFYRAIHFLSFMATLTAMAVAWEALLHPTSALSSKRSPQLACPLPTGCATRIQSFGSWPLSASGRILATYRPVSRRSQEHPAGSL
ncbi:carbohydrate ABC transporter permease [Bradyrhizobium cenepequi]|uniref:carbohydrate ABC transporter permease n=1 Tax=Bradyrhizobium cenepequi TaxID=2821403 RepID=UPI001CE28630|nr:hypothetical protein [Bradyrhizobium cenepequi]